MIVAMIKQNSQSRIFGILGGGFGVFRFLLVFFIYWFSSSMMIVICPCFLVQGL